MKQRRYILVLQSCLAICFATSCSKPAPAECRAFVACFAAESSPYDVESERNANLLVASGASDFDQIKRELAQAYGEGGDCWVGSEEGWVWVTCREACVAAIVEHCGQSPEEAGGCLETTPDGNQFAAPELDGLRCSEMEALQPRLEAQAQTLRQNAQLADQ